jgi:hypothetical protein
MLTVVFLLMLILGSSCLVKAGVHKSEISTDIWLKQTPDVDASSTSAQIALTDKHRTKSAASGRHLNTFTGYLKSLFRRFELQSSSVQTFEESAENRSNVDLKLAPTVSAMENDSIYLNVDLVAEPYGNLFADDFYSTFPGLDPVSADEDYRASLTDLRLQQACYAHRLLQDRLAIAWGITNDPLFVEKDIFSLPEQNPYFPGPFVNSPLEYGNDAASPTVSASIAPRRNTLFLAFAQIPEFSEAFGFMRQSTVPDNPWGNSLFGLEITSLARLFDSPAVYRLNTWTYGGDPPSELDSGKWGGAFSLGHQLTKNVGVFGTVGYDKPSGSGVDWTYTLGAGFNRSSYRAGEDEKPLWNFGFNVGGDVKNRNASLTTEGYYNVPLRNQLTLTPNIYYTLQTASADSPKNQLTCAVTAELTF